MFKINWRYLKGYLRIKIYENNIERFVNLCANKNILLWDLITCRDSYEANIRLQDFKKLKPIVRKTKTKVRVTERIGFPFFVRKHRSRRLFAGGFIICVILMFYFSSIIWSIQFQGNLNCTDENLLKFLKTKEIFIGKFKSDIDCFELAKDIRNEYDNIIWVSVSIKGSELLIQLKENNDSFKDVVNSERLSNNAYDIYADYDCTITSIVTRTGIPVVKEGETVSRGDLLVSGKIPVYNDMKEIIDYRQCKANADIAGKVVIDYKDIVSCKYKSKKIMDTFKQEYFIQFGSVRFSFGSIKNNYSHFQLHSNINSFGGVIFGKRKVVPYILENAEYNLKEIQIILSRNYNDYCDELKKKGVAILQNNVKIDTWSDKAGAYGTILVNMPVGQLKKSEITELGDSLHGNDGNNN